MKCNKYNERSIMCQDCKGEHQLSCFEEPEFKCIHWDGGSCLCINESLRHHSDCAMDPDACDDYEECE